MVKVTELVNIILMIVVIGLVLMLVKQNNEIKELETILSYKVEVDLMIETRDSIVYNIDYRDSIIYDYKKRIAYETDIIDNIIQPDSVIALFKDLSNGK